VVIAGSEAANDDLPGLFGMAPYPLQDADSMRQFVHGKSEPFDGTRTYSTTKQFVAWWSASVAQRYGDRFQVFTVSPGSNMSTNAARNVTGFKRFLFTKVMPAIGPLMGMDQPVALGAGRYIDVLNATDGRFESGRTYTSAPKKMTGPLHPVEYAHLRDVSRQDAAWGVLQEVSAAAVPKENLGRGELG
jgi:hypothetical protein